MLNKKGNDPPKLITQSKDTAAELRTEERTSGLNNHQGFIGGFAGQQRFLTQEQNNISLNMERRTLILPCCEPRIKNLRKPG